MLDYLGEKKVRKREEKNMMNPVITSHVYAGLFQFFFADQTTISQLLFGR